MPVTGEYVEPVQLQVVCHQLWNNCEKEWAKSPAQAREITATNLQKFGGVDKALGDFYESVLETARAKTRVREKALRRWFERQLITPAGTRGTVFQDDKWTGSIRNEVVAVLVDRHIIRAEVRARARWCELTHDRLIKPIRRSNREWRERQRRRRCWDMGLCLLTLLVVALFVCWQAFEMGYKTSYEMRTADIIRDADKQLGEEKSQELRLKSLMATITRLWEQNASNEVVRRYLIRNDANVPRDLGVYMSPYAKDVNLVAPAERWPLSLEYNAGPDLDEKELLGQWSELAGLMAGRWGIPAPRRIKLTRSERLGANQFHVIAMSLVPSVAQPSDTSQKYPRVGGKRSLAVQRSVTQEAARVPRARPPGYHESTAERRLDIPLRPNHVLVTETQLSERMRSFLDRYRNECTPVPQLTRGGPWWMVPRWTRPLWETEGRRASPPEGAVAFTVANSLLDYPNLVLTRDCVDYLLQRTAERFPQTVAEALATRGGVEGIQRDLIEIVGRHKRPLTRLAYLLDTLAGCPGLSTPEAAEQAVAAAYKNRLVHDGKLQGNQARAPAVVEEEPPPAEFRQVYAEAGLWLPEFLSEIRVYPGRETEKRLVTKEWQPRPEVSEALTDLRGNLYRRFGLVMPIVRFYPPEDKLADDSVRIEVANQAEEDEGTKPIRLTPDRAIEQLVGELRLRYVASRTWWLPAETVQAQLEGLPDFLRKWLEARFTLTDVKLILRALIVPTKEERDAYAEHEQAEQGLTHTTPQQTLRDLPWLLGSLTFWVNAMDSPAAEAHQIAECLGRSQVPPPEVEA